MRYQRTHSYEVRPSIGGPPVTRDRGTGRVDTLGGIR